MSHSKPGSRARSGTAIKMFLGCSRSRSASVADQLDRPPAPLDLVSRTELSPMLVPRSLVSIGTIHFASALCWWLVAVVGELTSSFLIIPFFRKAAEGEKGGRVSDIGLCGNVCLSAQHGGRGGSLARLLLHAARSVDRVLSGAAQLAEGGGERREQQRRRRRLAGLRGPRGGMGGAAR